MKRKDFEKDRHCGCIAGHAASQQFISQPYRQGAKTDHHRCGPAGQDHLELLLRRSDVDVVAICDIDERMLTSAKATVTKAAKMPQIFTGDKYAWKKCWSLRVLMP